MKRAILPPLLVVALASMLTAPVPTRAAELLLSVEPAPIAVVDPVGAILRHFEPTAAFVGRTPAGMGYVLMSSKRAYFVRPQPGGIVRVIPADPRAVQDLVCAAGWAV